MVKGSSGGSVQSQAGRVKHPPGMYVLAFTEIFERLSYYTLSFLLVLYASDTVANGGLGWTKEQALGISSMYTFAAFTLPIVGGFLADRWLGVYRSALFGAVLIILGHLTMFLSDAEHLPFFFAAISLVASGTAFFKPCLPSLLGRLYPENATHREAGFSYYYMGINIGAMIAGFSGGLLLQNFGYHAALGSAAFGMALGLIVFVLGRRLLIPVDGVQTTQSEGTQRLSSEQLASRKKALSYLCLSFLFFAMWCVVYNIETSGTLSLYIEKYTQRTVFGYTIPTTFFQSLEAVGIVVTAPLLIAFYRLLGQNRSPHFFTQMNIAVLISALALAYLTHMTSQVNAADLNSGTPTLPFTWYQMGFLILMVAVSEVMISPVMMSAISVLAPARYRTIFQSFQLFIIGSMGLVAGKIGALSFEDPFHTFLTVTLVAAAITLFYAIIRKAMVAMAEQATPNNSHT